MELNVYKDLANRGIFRFYDGALFYIEEIQYSADGKTHWENTFNPSTHISTLDGITTLPGHKYRRTRNSGETKWNYPHLWVAEDGQDVMMRVDGNKLQYKLELATNWTDLYDLSTLKGETGEQGVQGEGWHIDYANYLDVRQACCSTVVNCGPCNPNVGSSSISSLSTFLSLGNHKLTLADIGNGTTYWHTTDGSTWAQSTTANEGLAVVAWKATGNNDSNNDALTINRQGYELLFSSLGSPYNSIGKVYICADGVWTELMNVTTPTGYVKVSTNDSLGYLEAKVDDFTIESYDSDSDAIEDKIRVKDGGINEFKITATAIQDGLVGGTGDPIKVNVTDLVGFGIKDYVSVINGEKNLQFYADDVVSDGIVAENTTTVDGEERDLIRVNVGDFVTSIGTNYTGLETSTERGISEVDTYDNIYIKNNDCLDIDANGLKVVADELTIEAEGLTALQVKDDGITKTKINPDVFNVNKGFNITNLDATGVEIKLATTTEHDNLEFNGTGELQLKDNGIYARHLNDDILDEANSVGGVGSGLRLAHDTGLSTKLKPNGGILKDSDGLYLDSEDLLTDEAVKSIRQGVTILRNDVTINGDTNTYIDTNVTLTASPNTVTVEAVLDLAALEAKLIDDGFNNSSGSYVTESITPADWSTTAEIKTYIDTQDNLDVKLNHWYNNIYISDGNGAYTTQGLFLKSQSGEVVKRLVMDENGNLDTVTST